jgi:hypothetical protein
MILAQRYSGYTKVTNTLLPWILLSATKYWNEAREREGSGPATLIESFEVDVRKAK